MPESGGDHGGRSKVLLDEDQIGRTLARMTHEMAEQAPDLGALALVGIQEGGVELAVRLAALFTRFYGVTPPTGAIDITFYRDDIDIRLGRDSMQPRSLYRSAFDVRETIVLVDDVLYQADPGRHRRSVRLRASIGRAPGVSSTAAAISHQTRLREERPWPRRGGRASGRGRWGRQVVIKNRGGAPPSWVGLTLGPWVAACGAVQFQ